jgi:hypothetical protein
MPNIVISAEHTRAAQDAVWEWFNSQPKEGLGRIAVLPPEGTAADGQKILYGVPDAALPTLRKRGIPFENA